MNVVHIHYGVVWSLRKFGIIPIGTRPRNGNDQYRVADEGAVGSCGASKYKHPFISFTRIVCHIHRMFVS